MERGELYRLLALGPETVNALGRVERELDLGRVEPQIAALCHQETAGEAYRELKEALGDDPDGMKMLCCQLECARRAWDAYRGRGIPDSVFTDTMRCFQRFIGESRRMYGRLLFDRGWWTWRQASLSLFRLGALEFELREAGTAAIHIPSDADLSGSSVDRSLEAARSFFGRFFGEIDRFTCHSWLLSPELVPLLRENSHILAFQRRFEIVGEDREDREFIRWLFEAPADTPPERLPERTSLQRAVKNLLLSGGTVGSAYGIMSTDRMDNSGGNYDDT